MTDLLLAELAARHGVATDYADWRDRSVEVPEQTVVAVLAALGVDASTPQSRQAALDAEHADRWRQVLPPTVVQRDGVGGAVVAVHCRHGASVDVRVECEDGSVHTDVEQLMHWVEPVEVDGVLRGEATYRLPADLPTGWHRLIAVTDDEVATATLVVVPFAVDLHRIGDARAWGLTVQLYAARSAGSWGIGDLADLAAIATWVGEHGGGFVLVSPLAAAAPVTPVEPSPYFPATRQFTSPLYLRVEALPEYAAAGWGTRKRVDDLRAELVADEDDRIDRDRVWATKRTAFALLWPLVRTDPVRLADVTAYRAEQGEALERFALWCALAERHGGSWPHWPADLHRFDSTAVAAAREELADRIAFHCWLQMCCDQQLAAAQQAATDAGQSIGIVHDLPVGVHPGGADSWAAPDVFATGVSVGAPADGFNQQGQDWRQPPWRPDRLAASGYAVYRDLLRAAFRHAGGLRVDHVLGLFRQWWTPDGMRAADGAYVRYDANAMLGILTLEAQRAGALVVGEDLGTIEPGVRETLAARAILGSTVLLFETDRDGEPKPPDQWRELTLATVTTHDLPTVAGLLDLAHVDLRADLGLLDRPVEEERAAAERSRNAWLALARERDLLAAAGSRTDEAFALHGLLAQSPCRLVAAALGDLVGDPRQPNQPGTIDEHPNWCLPLARPTAHGTVEPVRLDDALASAASERVVQLLARWVEHVPVR